MKVWWGPSVGGGPGPPPLKSGPVPACKVHRFIGAMGKVHHSL